MLFIREFDGITQYVVCNEDGKCLIVTTSSKIAMFVERNVKGIPNDLRLKRQCPSPNSRDNSVIKKTEPQCSVFYCVIGVMVISS